MYKYSSFGLPSSFLFELSCYRSQKSNVNSVLISLYYCFTFLNSYSGNINLHEGGRKTRHLHIIIGSSVGAAVLLIATVVSCLFMHKGKKGSYNQGIVWVKFELRVSVIGYLSWLNMLNMLNLY